MRVGPPPNSLSNASAAVADLASSAGANPPRSINRAIAAVADSGRSATTAAAAAAPPRHLAPASPAPPSPAPPPPPRGPRRRGFPNPGGGDRLEHVTRNLTRGYPFAVRAVRARAVHGEETTGARPRFGVVVVAPARLPRRRRARRSNRGWSARNTER